MIGVGLTAVAARRHGEGAHGLAAVAAGTTLVVALLGGASCALPAGSACRSSSRMMGTPPEVTELGRLYLRRT